MSRGNVAWVKEQEFINNRRDRRERTKRLLKGYKKADSDFMDYLRGVAHLTDHQAHRFTPAQFKDIKKEGYNVFKIFETYRNYLHAKGLLNNKAEKLCKSYLAYLRGCFHKGRLAWGLRRKYNKKAIWLILSDIKRDAGDRT